MTAADRDASRLGPRTRLSLRRLGLGTVLGLLTAKLWRRGSSAAGGRAAVMVTRSDIEPANHGAAVKIRRLAESMSRQLDAVFIVTDDRRHYFAVRDGVTSRERFPGWLSLLAPPRPWVILRLLLRGFPVSNLFLYYPLADASYARRALWLGRRHGVSLWQAEFPAYAKACLRAREVFGGKVVLAEHNVEYQRIGEQVPDLGQSRFELLRHWELRLCRAVDAVVCVSREDREALVRDGVPDGLLHVIPHGVDLAAYREVEPVNVRAAFGLPGDCMVLAYHGTYRYPPNLEAMRWLGAEILPRLDSGGGEVRVLAIGLDPPRRSPHPAILFTGAVKDLAGTLRGCDMAVVPLRQGGGTRMKVLDYFAAGLPVISTAKGVEGLGLTPGSEYTEAEDAAGFVRAIRGLRDDPARRAELVRQGSLYVASLDWDAIGRRYLDLLD